MYRHGSIRFDSDGFLHVNERKMKTREILKKITVRLKDGEEEHLPTMANRQCRKDTHFEKTKHL